MSTHKVEFRVTILEALTSDKLVSFTDMANSVLIESFPDDPTFTPEWMLARYSSQSVSFPKKMVIAEVDGKTIGFSHLEFDRSGENDDSLHIDIEVRPEYRRQGVATALLTRSVELGQADGRTKLFAWGHRTKAMTAFWTAAGACDSFSSSANRLVLDAVDQTMLDRWIDAAEPVRQAGYQMHGWHGRCPHEHLEQFAVALGGMNDMPLDDLDLAPEAHTPKSIRDHEERWINGGSEPRVLLITDADGAAAAMTEVLVHGFRPEELWQESTATLIAHRRKGLGRWIKAVMMKQLLADAMVADYIVTGNADSNASMRAINDEMGYQHHSNFAGFQVNAGDLRI